jgi:hypothetical protein
MVVLHDTRCAAVSTASVRLAQPKDDDLACHSSAGMHCVATTAVIYLARKLPSCTVPLVAVVAVLHGVHVQCTAASCSKCAACVLSTLLHPSQFIY